MCVYQANTYNRDVIKLMSEPISLNTDVEMRIPCFYDPVTEETYVAKATLFMISYKMSDTTDTYKQHGKKLQNHLKAKNPMADWMDLCEFENDLGIHIKNSQKPAYGRVRGGLYRLYDASTFIKIFRGEYSRDGIFDTYFKKMTKDDRLEFADSFELFCANDNDDEVEAEEVDDDYDENNDVIDLDDYEDEDDVIDVDGDFYECPGCDVELPREVQGCFFHNLPNSMFQPGCGEYGDIFTCNDCDQPFHMVAHKDPCLFHSSIMCAAKSPASVHHLVIEVEEDEKDLKRKDIRIQELESRVRQLETCLKRAKSEVRIFNFYK